MSLANNPFGPAVFVTPTFRRDPARSFWAEETAIPNVPTLENLGLIYATTIAKDLFSRLYVKLTPSRPHGTSDVSVFL